jgi:hypothetical protein
VGIAYQSTKPSGAVLVGSWYSFGVLYEFTASGTMRRDRRIETGGCVSTSGESGTAVVNGNALTMYFTSGAFSFCGKPSTETYKPVSET